MGLFDSIRAIGRAIDPTSSKAPLGGYVKQGIVALTGQAGASALDAAAGVGGALRSGGGAATAPLPTTTGGPVPPSAGSPFKSAASWGLPLALIAAAAAVLLLVLRRR